MDFTSKSSSHLEHIKCRYCPIHWDIIDNSEELSLLTDEKDVYKKMVQDTFNVQIKHYPLIGGNMCNACVARLRDAVAFKRQVLEVEVALATQYETKMACESLNQEIDSSGFDEYEYDISESDIEDYEWEKKIVTENMSVKEQTLKMEPVEEIKVISRAKRKKANNLRKNKKSYSKTADGRHAKVNKKGKENPDQSREQKSVLKDLRKNTLKLVTNSNMCLFKSKRTKFACYTCSESFLDMKQLREHSQAHNIDDHLKMNLNRCRGLSYKAVDISNLICKKCSHPCWDLSALQEHLASTHEVKFNSAQNLLVPYKLEEGFKCVFCQANFNSFARLSIHMNTHSTSNVCEICGIAYMNRQNLRNHLNSMHREKNCSICSAIFPTSWAKAKHMRLAHKTGLYKRYCLKCDMTFQYAYKLAEHMITSHGAKRQSCSLCEQCSKKFPTAAALRVHVRSVHIGERNYPCSVCDRRFFTSCDKKRHERTHGDQKSFACDFCEVKFRSKDSMRRHLRRQHQNTKTNH